MTTFTLGGNTFERTPERLARLRDALAATERTLARLWDRLAASRASAVRTEELEADEVYLMKTIYTYSKHADELREILK